MICEVAQDVARSGQEVAGQKESSDDIPPAAKECRKYKQRPPNLTYVHPLNDLCELTGLRDNETLKAGDTELRGYWQSRYDQYNNATEGLLSSPVVPDSPPGAVSEDQAASSDDNMKPDEQAAGGNVQFGEEG